MKKPDAVTVITRESFKDQIWPLPVSDLLYVGRATTEKIRLYGIRTIGDLAQADRAMLIHRLGVNGEKLWVFANGLDQSAHYAMRLRNPHQKRWSRHYLHG